MPNTFDPIELGPCTMKYGTLDIDLTIGGVTLHAEPMLKEIKVDIYGQSVVDYRIIGWNVKASVPMAQTDIATLEKAAIFLEKVESGGDIKLQDRVLGTSLRHHAQELILHPAQLPIADTSMDVTLFMAVPSTPMELKWTYEDERVYNVDFQALPKAGSEPSAAGNFFCIGESAAAAALKTLTFDVQNVATNPIVGAEVSIHGWHTMKSTDALGLAHFVVPAGDYIYIVTAAGYNHGTGIATVAAVDVTQTVTLTV